MKQCVGLFEDGNHKQLRTQFSQMGPATFLEGERQKGYGILTNI